MENKEPKKYSTVEAGIFQAITTKYIGPTNYKGGRIKATTASGLSVTLGYKSALDVGENHAAACKALVDKLNWGGTWLGGGTKDGESFVMLESRLD